MGAVSLWSNHSPLCFRVNGLVLNEETTGIWREQPFLVQDCPMYCSTISTAGSQCQWHPIPNHSDNPKFSHTFASILLGAMWHKSHWKAQPWWKRDYRINPILPTILALHILWTKNTITWSVSISGNSQTERSLKKPIHQRKGQVIPMQWRKCCHTQWYKVLWDHRGKSSQHPLEGRISYNRWHLIRNPPITEEKEKHSSNRNSLWKQGAVWTSRTWLTQWIGLGSKIGLNR